MAHRASNSAPNGQGGTMFGKVFASLWEGSMVGKSDLQLVFIFLLAKADRIGHADYHPTVISAMTGIAEDRVREALLELEGPDPESRSEKLGGARLERLSEHRDWGWQIVNWPEYQGIRSAEDRQRQNREAQARYRNRRSQSKQEISPVSESQHSKPPSAHVDVDRDVDTESNTSPEVAEIFSLEAPLPTISGTEWEPTKAMVEAWRTAYPEVDVVGTMSEMRAWLVSNPSRMKTTRGMGRFVNEWLKREAEKYAGQEA